MIFMVPVWLQIIFFIIGNGPSIIKLIIEIRKLMSDVKSVKDKQAIMKASEEDLIAYKEHKDMNKLLDAISRKKKKYMETMEAK